MLIIYILFFVASASGQHVQQKYAITDEVILNENGTWEYIEEDKQNYNNKKVPPKIYNYEFKPKMWEERMEQAAHEYWRIRAHAELEQLGIPVTRYSSANFMNIPGENPGIQERIAHQERVVNFAGNVVAHL